MKFRNDVNCHICDKPIGVDRVLGVFDRRYIRNATYNITPILKAGNSSC